MTRPHPREAIVDSNILVRILTKRPPDLAEKAAQLLAAAERRRVAMILTPLIVAEIVYVLGSVYRWVKRDIADRLLQLLDSGTLVVLERDLVIQALEWYRDLPQVHFADAYIAAYALQRSAGVAASFDRGLRRIPGLTVLSGAADLGA